MSDHAAPKEGDLVVYYDENEEAVEGQIDSLVKECENEGTFLVIVEGEEIIVEWDDDYDAWHEQED